MTYCSLDAPRTSAIQVYFQPVVNLRDSGCRAYEALARWNTTLGELPVSEMLQAAVEVGFAQILNVHLWEHAVFDYPLKRVSINASPWDLTSQLPELLRCAEDAHALGKEFIVEIIRPTYRGSEQAPLQRAIAQLRQVGVPVWATDHGLDSGVAENLIGLSLDAIRVDCCNYPELQDLRAKVQNIHALGAVAIAENVDAEPLLRRAIAAGFDHAQGNYLGRAQPAQQVVAALSAGMQVAQQLHGGHGCYVDQSPHLPPRREGL